MLACLRVSELARAIVVAGLSRHLLGLQVATRPDGVERPVIGIDHDGVPGLVRWALVEIRQKRLRIRAGVSGPPNHCAALSKALPPNVPQELPNSCVNSIKQPSLLRNP